MMTDPTPQGPHLMMLLLAWVACGQVMINTKKSTEKQLAVINAFSDMEVAKSYTCT